MNVQFKYSLDSGSKKFRCPECGKKRFVRYLNNETGNYLPDNVGRCDREISCGYHRPPREADGIELSNALYSPPQPQEPPTPSTLPFSYVERSLVDYERNSLIKWLSTILNSNLAADAARLYKVGTSKDGWAIFWQIDRAGKVRSGKMMKYDSTGHRVKDGYSQDWIHSKLKKTGHLDEFELVQCLYGLHIVDNSKPIAIVESEKTAIIASQYLPQFHWIAAGMLQGINEYKLQPLKGMKIVLFPDIGAFDLWNEKAQEFSHLADVQVSTLLERKAPDKHKGYDLADYLTQYSLDDFLTPYGRNPWTGEIFDQRGYPADWDNINLITTP